MTDGTSPRISTDLDGQVAIVTGAGRGLGRAIAQTLAGAGAKVACIDVSEDTLAESVEAIRAAGGTAEPIPCDVTDSDRVAEVVGEVVDKLGGLNILVNNAGITRDTLISTIDETEYLEQVDSAISFRGIIFFAQV